MKNKGFLLTVIVVIIIIATIIVHANIIKGETDKFAIIMTSDLQSQIAPFEMKVGEEISEVGGLARVSTAVGNAAEKADYYTVLSSGDDIIAPLLNVFGGVPEMRCMTIAGYSGVCPGNHEFDRGADVYANAIKSAGFQIVSANMDFENEYLQSRIHDYYRWTTGKYKIHVFGLMTPDFDRLTKSDGVEINRDFIGVAKEQVEIANRDGCDMIIAITHLGANLDRELAEAVQDIDIIVGGHSHEFVYEKIGKTIIIQDGAGGSHLGVLNFDFDGEEISNERWETVLLDSTVGANPQIDSIVDYYMSVLQDSLGRKIGSTKKELDTRKTAVRMREAAVGNLITDSWLTWFEDAYIALINGGSIRGDRIYPVGELTYLDINSILPFRGEIIRVELSGAQIKHLLEMSASAVRVDGDDCPDTCRIAEGGFLQVAGIEFDINLTRQSFKAIYEGRSVSGVIDSGDRVSNVKINVDGQWNPIYPERKYSVLVNDWLASGGDGYYIFVDEEIKKIPTTVYATDMLIEYVIHNSPISPKTDGRINIIE